MAGFYKISVVFFPSAKILMRGFNVNHDRTAGHSNEDAGKLLDPNSSLTTS